MNVHRGNETDFMVTMMAMKMVKMMAYGRSYSMFSFNSGLLPLGGMSERYGKDKDKL